MYYICGMRLDKRIPKPIDVFCCSSLMPLIISVTLGSAVAETVVVNYPLFFPRHYRLSVS